MTEFFPLLCVCEVKDLQVIRRGQEVEVRLNGAPYCQGRIEQVDAALGIICIRDVSNQRKLLSTSDFSLWRYVL